MTRLSTTSVANGEYPAPAPTFIPKPLVAVAAILSPVLLYVSTLLPPPWSGVALILAGAAAYMAGLPLPVPKWAEGKPLVGVSLLPIVAGAAALAFQFAPMLPEGLPRTALTLLALLLTLLAGKATPNVVTSPPGSGLSAINRIGPMVLLLAVIGAGAAHAGEDLRGTITAAAVTKNNADTAVPFSLNNVSLVVIQCDTAAYVRQAATSATATATSSTARLLEAGKERYFNVAAGGRFLAVLPVSGTSVCQVWAVY